LRHEAGKAQGGDERDRLLRALETFADIFKPAMQNLL
jgi:hypothetical protein